MIKGDENGLVQTHPHEFPVKNQSDNSSRSLLGLGNPGIHRLQPLVLTRMQGLGIPIIMVTEGHPAQLLQ